MEILAEKKAPARPLRKMRKTKIIEIIIAAIVGAGVTMISKVVEAYLMNHITSAGNIAGGIAASVTYLVERFKNV